MSDTTKINVNQVKHTIRILATKDRLAMNDQYILDMLVSDLKQLGIVTTIDGKKVTFFKNGQLAKEASQQ